MIFLCTIIIYPAYRKSNSLPMKRVITVDGDILITAKPQKRSLFEDSRLLIMDVFEWPLRKRKFSKSEDVICFAGTYIHDTRSVLVSCFRSRILGT